MHPGRGKAAVIRAEADDVEQGGFYLFLPSGRTMTVGWHQPKPIQPTLEAAKKYAADVIERLQRTGGEDDIRNTNWTSVTAAIQRCILDWNDKVKAKISIVMADSFGPEAARLRRMH
jgi:hypothetical protein